MGPRVSTPVTKKYVDHGNFGKYHYITMKMQNIKPDFFTYILTSDYFHEKNLHIFAIFDGQFMKDLAKFLSDENFVKLLSENENFKEGNYKNALEEIILYLDNNIENPNYRKKITNQNQIENLGCTIIISIFDFNSKKIFTANLGNSKALLISDDYNKVDSLVDLHDIKNEKEKKRVEEVGITLQDGGIDNTYQMTRGIGFLNLKRGRNEGVFINELSISEIEINEKMQYLILGNCGFVSVLTDEEIGILCKEKFEENCEIEEVAGEIADRSCIGTANFTGKFIFVKFEDSDSGSKSNNISCIFVKLN